MILLGNYLSQVITDMRPSPRRTNAIAASITLEVLDHMRDIDMGPGLAEVLIHG